MERLWAVGLLIETAVTGFSTEFALALAPIHTAEKRAKEMNMWGAIAITSVIGTLTWLGITYPPYAEARGWPLGRWSGGNAWYTYHGIAAISVLFSGWKYGGFIGLAAVMIGGWILAFILIHVIRSWSQMVSLLSLPLALAWHWNIP